MSTTYYALPLEEVVKAGVQHLYFQTIDDTLVHLHQRLREGATYLERYTSGEASSEVELGCFSNGQFSPISREVFRQVLTGDYIVFSESREIYTPQQFIDQLQRWKFKVDSWLQELPEPEYRGLE